MTFAFKFLTLANQNVCLCFVPQVRAELSGRLPKPPSTGQTHDDRRRHCPLQPQPLQKRKGVPVDLGYMGGSRVVPGAVPGFGPNVDSITHERETLPQRGVTAFNGGAWFVLL